MVQSELTAVTHPDNDVSPSVAPIQLSVLRHHDNLPLFLMPACILLPLKEQPLGQAEGHWMDSSRRRTDYNNSSS